MEEQEKKKMPCEVERREVRAIPPEALRVNRPLGTMGMMYEGIDTASEEMERTITIVDKGPEAGN